MPEDQGRPYGYRRSSDGGMVINGRTLGESQGVEQVQML